MTCLSQQEALVIKIKQALRDRNRSRVRDKENEIKKADKSKQQDDSFDEKNMNRLLNNVCMNL